MRNYYCYRSQLKIREYHSVHNFIAIEITVLFRYSLLFRPTEAFIYILIVLLDAFLRGWLINTRITESYHYRYKMKSSNSGWQKYNKNNDPKHTKARLKHISTLCFMPEELKHVRTKRSSTRFSFTVANFYFH